MTRVGPQVNWLSRAAATADDVALARLVGMLDGLRQRGEADQVLDLARQRLRALRPPRPLGLTRLLFLPLDGAIVPSPRWRRGEPLVPRGALSILAAAVFDRLGPEATTLAEACEGRTTSDAEAVATIGETLWLRAAAVLPPHAPADWPSTGLKSTDFAAIGALCVPVWKQGPALWKVMRAPDLPADEELVRAALGPLQKAGPQPFSAGLATLLLRSAAPGRLAMAAARIDISARPVVLQMLDSALDEPLPPLDTLDLTSATAAAETLARRFADLEGCTLLNGEPQRRLAQLRREADDACRERFLSAAEQQVVAPAALLTSAPEVRDEDILAIEAGARGLKALSLAGRKIGSAAIYDRAMASMTEAFGGLAARASHPDGLRPVDLARTIEIIAGPDAAEHLLARQAGRQGQPAAAMAGPGVGAVKP